MGIVLAPGEVKPGDRIEVELLPEPRPEIGAGVGRLSLRKLQVYDCRRQ